MSYTPGVLVDNTPVPKPKPAEAIVTSSIVLPKFKITPDEPKKKKLSQKTVRVWRGSEMTVVIVP